ncbi:hypothetical protein V1509DRAFT_495490 [Lipomyces kononenkoae]
MHSAPSPSLVPTAAPNASQFLKLSAPLESEKRNFMVLTTEINRAAVTDDRKVLDTAELAEPHARSESVASTAWDSNGTAIQRWVSNIDIPEEATF